jgi:hypothetical protein
VIPAVSSPKPAAADISTLGSAWARRGLPRNRSVIKKIVHRGIQPVPPTEVAHREPCRQLPRLQRILSDNDRRSTVEQHVDGPRPIGPRRGHRSAELNHHRAVVRAKREFDHVTCTLSTL